MLPHQASATASLQSAPMRSWGQRRHPSSTASWLASRTCGTGASGMGRSGETLHLPVSGGDFAAIGLWKYQEGSTCTSLQLAPKVSAMVGQ